uniref:Uncharacterized protein n=1 Tax=Trichuris muris TaxID=70415 RepID=A0A5S6QJG1_TRIMR
MNQSRRSDRISHLMSEHLLLGHRMLATSCDKCGCVLFGDHDGGEFCVSCSLHDEETVQPEEPNGSTAGASAVREKSSPQASTGDQTGSRSSWQSDKLLKSTDEAGNDQAVFADVRKFLVDEIRLTLTEYQEGKLSTSSRLQSLKLLRSLVKTLRSFADSSH